MFRVLSFIAMAVAPTVVIGQSPTKYTTVPLTLHPAALPVPLGMVQLYPGYPELTPGNRVQGLLKVFMEQDQFFKLVGSEEWQKELEMPLAEFKEKSKYRTTVASGIAYGDKYTKMMGYLDRGARMKSIEWNEYFEMRSDGFFLLIPEVQKIRLLASALMMRLRNEIVTGDFAKATVSIQTFFGIAQALEQHPCLIGNLVGLAIANFAIKGIEELIQQPDCPNFFWALCDLPTPLLNQRMAVGGEKIFLTSQFGRYLTTERSLNDREIDAFLTDMNELLKIEDQRGGVGSFIKSAKVRFGLAAADEARMKSCRDRLVLNGVDADVVKAMPSMQIAIIDEFDRYMVLRDEYFKAYMLPFHQAEPWLKKSDDELKKARTRGDIIGPALLPAVWKVKMAQARIDQRIAHLQTIEAIRLYAKNNGGKLPKTLDTTGLPMAVDPFNGKNLTYEVKDGVATLFGTDTRQGEINNRRFLITIAK